MASFFFVSNVIVLLPTQTQYSIQYVCINNTLIWFPLIMMMNTTQKNECWAAGHVAEAFVRVLPWFGGVA